jgi:hypothetical protein
MEPAALARTNSSCVLEFSPRTSRHHGFRNYCDLTALMRSRLDVALVSTSTETALRKRYDRAGSGDEVGERVNVSNP